MNLDSDETGDRSYRFRIKALNVLFLSLNLNYLTMVMVYLQYNNRQAIWNFDRYLQIFKLIKINLNKSELGFAINKMISGKELTENDDHNTTITNHS